MIRQTVRLVLLSVCLSAQGCAVAGQSLGALGQLIDMAISLAMAAAPFALSYYLFKKSKE